ncbi:MAG: tRNA modification GTPase [Proteobacteria bacterium]|nr:tRNA modification GTPase [Pseudomonadota bacterium]
MAQAVEYQPAIICAVTPRLSCAVAMIRCSGESCHELLRPCLRFAKTLSPKDWPLHDRKMLRCEVIDPERGEVIDDGLCVFFKGPNSYTGEDVCELYIHGGLYLVDSVIKVCLRLGFRASEPGEFTRRAYLAGKIDLTQAEGIRELTEATSESQWRAARTLVRGALREHIESIRTKIIHIRSLIEASIDFPEESDTQNLHQSEYLLLIRELRKELLELQITYPSGRVATHGLQVVLCGRANAGKSSLMNALAGKSRSIVTDTPGTTRDYLDVSLLIRGHKVIVYDTAGLRQPLQVPQKLGWDGIPEAEIIAIKKTLSLALKADLVIVVQPNTDASPLSLTDYLSCYGDDLGFSGAQISAPMLQVRTFGDQITEPPAWGEDSDVVVALGPDQPPQGIEPLKAKIARIASQSSVLLNPEVFICTPRQKMAIDQALLNMNQALQLAETDDYEELLAYEMKNVSDSLDSILGNITTDDLLDQMFSQFCLGK